MLQYFNSFQKSAFRLELLQIYNVESEKAAIQKFQQSGQVAPNEEWNAIILSAKQRGAEIKRVHIVEEPYSDYLNFELAAYEHNRRAGEQIYLLKKSIYDQLALPLTDFWLFDDQTVLKMNYTSQGQFLDFDKVNSDITIYLEAKKKLLKAVTNPT